MPEKVGNFSRLTVFFRFERQIGHHLIQTFAPSALVVCLSWFSFWLGLDAIPGRVTLLVTCMLTLVTMFTGLRADIPPVAYVKVSLRFHILLYFIIFVLRLQIYGWQDVWCLFSQHWENSQLLRCSMFSTNIRSTKFQRFYQW